MMRQVRKLDCSPVSAVFRIMIFCFQSFCFLQPTGFAICASLSKSHRWEIFSILFTVFRILLLLFFWAFRNQIWELPNIAIDVPEKKEGILIICGSLCSLLLPLLNAVLSVMFLPFAMCFSFWLFGL